jgi:SHS2 domain-containing protein
MALEYEILDHTADLGVIVKADSLKNLFVNAANVMADLMVKGDGRGKKEVRGIVIEGMDYADLMVRWLGEILYLFYSEKLIGKSIQIKSLTHKRISSFIEFTQFDPQNSEVIREIKAVTYHKIAVKKTGKTWETMVIFDI